MQHRDERVWAKFHELLSLQLHDGNAKLAKERPASNLFGSIASHKKVFEQAVAAVELEICCEDMVKREGH